MAMTANEIRQKFLDFFKKNGHTVVPSSSLVTDDPSVLLTTAGMQQFKPYYLGEKSPYGDKTASVQKCFRTSDIDDVGDESHLTFFEMLGNFSFNGVYFKKEAIEYAYEFITKEVGLKIDYVSVFNGEGGIEPDMESEKIWMEIKEKNNENFEIKKFGKEDNFWGPTGDEGPCGPTTEIYINGVEIWNLVFNEYYRDSSGSYTKLETLGVDTGMGLERLAMVLQNKNNVFETDLFAPFMETSKNNRIIADHLRGAVFLIVDGVEPSNIGRGYILRRLIRRAVRYGKILGAEENFTQKIAEIVIKNYHNFYPEIKRGKEKIIKELNQEEKNFRQTLEKGLKQFEKISSENISGHDAFILFSTYGFPIEMMQELAKERRIKVNLEEFKKELEKHRELSRTASQGMFKSGLAGHSEQEIKYHTATHLLLAALRRVLGNHVVQKGSNITPERLRLDFSHPEKLTEEQKQEVEKLVNEKIKENLEVVCEEMAVEEARKKGALGVFEHKYGKTSKVYSINNFSQEICGGPHVEKTGQLGEFKIKKEESVSSGTRRIKAVLK
jgi:alanyl-tRNA synthetase